MALQSSMMPDLYEPHGEVKTSLWLLLPLRLYVGLYFIFLAIQKTGERWLSQPQRMLDAIRPSIESPDYPFGFYQSFFYSAIEPHPMLFAYLLVFGKLLMGLSIGLGLLTRLSCLISLFMLLNFYLAKHPSLAEPEKTGAFAVMLLVMLLTGAGRAYGMDHYLRRKVPGWMA